MVMAGGDGQQVFLESDRLILRRFTQFDVGLLVELDSDPEVIRFTPDAPTTAEQVENEVLPAFLSYYERFDGYGFWAAIEKDTGTFVGWFHFRPAPGAPIDEPELGYRLRVPAWGKGYASEGSRALIDKGFAEFGVQRVVAGTMAANLRSRRVMEKAGLTFVRTFHEEWLNNTEGGEEGALEYALRKVDWEKSRGDR